jgi:hypothetical protein
MDKEKKEDAIKKLEQELKEEKKAEFARSFHFRLLDPILTVV